MIKFFQSLIWLVIFFLLINNTTLAQSNQCINYVAGIGEMEYFEYSGDEAKTLELIGVGGISSLNQNFYDNLKISYNIDKVNKTSGQGALKINVLRNGILSTSTNRLQIFYIFLRDELILPELENTNSGLISPLRDYYPQSGDRLIISFDFKSENSRNINYRIGSSMWDRNNNRSETIFINTSTSINNWQTFSTSVSVVNNIKYKGIRPLFFVAYAEKPNINTTSNSTFWIDNIRVFVERYNSSTNRWECLKLPRKLKNSSLNFAEVFSINVLPYKDDWLYFYLNTELWDAPNLLHALRIYFHDNSFKLVEYMSGEIEFKEKEGNVGSFRFKHISKHYRGRGLRFNIDPIIKIVNDMPISTWWNTDKKLKLTPNSPYPEFFLLDSSTTNKTITGWFREGRIPSQVYEIHNVVNLKNIKSIEYHNKHNFVDYVHNKDIKNIYWGIRIDSPNANLYVWNKSRQYFSGDEARFYLIRNRYREIVEKLKYSGKKLFANFGYRAMFTPTDRFYGIDKFLDGFMSEGFLIERYLTFKNPAMSHKEIQTVIENFGNKYSILMSYTNNSWCNNNSPTTTYLVSSFYLVNNPNVYISFEMPETDIVAGNPQIRVDSYGPLCRTSVMNLPLGQPLPVNNIEELVIASTTNYQNGALYRRRYEKGLVLLNTSDNLTFQYRLSSTTEPFTHYKDHLGNDYIFDNNSVNLNILPRSGLILYYPEVQSTGINLFEQ